MAQRKCNSISTTSSDAELQIARTLASLLRQGHLFERLHKLQQLHFLVFTQRRAVFVAGVAVAGLGRVKREDTQVVLFIHITQTHDIILASADEEFAGR